MKSFFLKLLLLIFLILVTMFFERIVPDYPQWKYITFVPVVMLSSNLVYRKKNNISRFMPLNIFLIVVLYVVLVNITAPGTIVPMLIPTIVGGAIALLVDFFFNHKKTEITE